jgi:hypothetical protein
MYALPRNSELFDAVPAMLGAAVVESGSGGIVRVGSNESSRRISVRGTPRQYSVVTLPSAGAASLHRTLADLRRFRRHAQNANIVSFDWPRNFLH